MQGRAIAGTAQVIGRGVTIKERVRNHYSKTQTTADPYFRELIGLDLTEEWPGALGEVKITFLREPR